MRKNPGNQQSTAPQYASGDTPFFILGCVRSGTTLLRDLLREHPRLECPEETHFFRWADPFGTPRFDRNYRIKLFERHRELDGVDSRRFYRHLEQARSREHLAYEYNRDYLEAIGETDGVRLFDKTPQNVYGIMLISAVYPEAKFIHIHRNPLNVVASLIEGKVMPKQNLAGAINYWTETVLILNEYKKYAAHRLLEIKYENITMDPERVVRNVLEFVAEDPSLIPPLQGKTYTEKDKYKKRLSADEINEVVESTEPYFSSYGYSV